MLSFSGAVGTTRPHQDFPLGLKELKERFSTKLAWNTLLAKVVNDTLCIAWQDNNIVLALSNAHAVHRLENFRDKVRKRPGKTSRNGQIVRQVFGEEPIKSLQIPSIIDDYNQFMGGVDLANQFRESYETHKPTLRNWWPLFYWFIDVICINAYRLYCLLVVVPPLPTAWVLPTLLLPLRSLSTVGSSLFMMFDTLWAPAFVLPVGAIPGPL